MQVAVGVHETQEHPVLVAQAVEEPVEPLTERMALRILAVGAARLLVQILRVQAVQALLLFARLLPVQHRECLLLVEQ
jgi:hypothetical protein